MLKTINATMAIGAVVFRTIEAVMYTAAVVSLLSLPALGEQFATAPSAGRIPIQTLADSVLSTHDHSTLVAVFAFCLGALIYYTLFYRSRLVPRWLSRWGLAGALLMFAASLMALLNDKPVTGYTLLIVPIAVQEMVFAVWLLVKGFDRRFQEAHRAGTSDLPQSIATGTPGASARREHDRHVATRENLTSDRGYLPSFSRSLQP